MTTLLQKNTAKYGLMIVAMAMLVSAAPALAAAKKATVPSPHRGSSKIIGLAVATQSATSTDDVQASDTPQTTTSSTTSTGSGQNVATTTPVTASTSGTASNTTSGSAPDPTPVSATARTTVAPVKTKTTLPVAPTAAAATTGTGSLVQGTANAGDIYASTRLSASQTQDLLVLALAMAVLGLILTGDQTLKRSLAGINNLIKIGPQPQARSSHA